MVLSKDKLRILTLNTHSLMEKDNDFCLNTLAETMIREEIDIAALQEVNQPNDADEVAEETLKQVGYHTLIQEKPVRNGNFALELSHRLQAMDGQYDWVWAYNHLGYWRFDEGIALFSRLPILETQSINVSTPDARCARVIPGIRTEYGWFWGVHMGWWQDEEDPFSEQWRKINHLCREKGGTHYLMGDFNSPAQKRGEGYDRITEDGWIDTYLRAKQKDDGVTVGGQIDGWRKENVDPMRIDFIFTNARHTTLSSRVIFNGHFHPIISDHCGVMIEEE